VEVPPGFVAATVMSFGPGVLQVNGTTWLRAQVDVTMSSCSVAFQR